MYDEEKDLTEQMEFDEWFSGLPENIKDAVKEGSESM